jgi:ParB/RepB/Spo0J family partition protein
MMLVDIELDKIEPNPWQPRKEFNEEELQQLGESIKKEGLKQAIGLRPHPRGKGMFQIIWGERRWRASRQVGLPTVRAQVMAATDTQMKKWAILENRSRKDTNPIENAKGTTLLRETGMSMDAIAKSVGRRKRELEDELLLLNLPDELQQQVIQGGLAKNLGIAIARLPRHQHMEVYKATLGRTQKAQFNYIYAIEMQNKNIVLFTLTMEQQKEVEPVRKLWERFRKLYEEIGKIDRKIFTETASDAASVYFMKSVSESMKELADYIEKVNKIKEVKEERRKKSVGSQT